VLFLLNVVSLPVSPLFYNSCCHFSPPSPFLSIIHISKHQIYMYVYIFDVWKYEWWRETGKDGKDRKTIDVNINNIIYERHLEKCMIMCVSVQTGKESINHIKITLKNF
jgi:hypothetical protein